MTATRKAILCLVVWTVLAATARAEPFQDGLAAYQKQDYAAALNHWLDAAGQGNTRAMLNLGVMYDRGQGVAESDAEAVKWYQAAAGAGIAEAQYYLGQKYRTGQGIGQDVGEAFKWYRRAAKQGQVQAQRMLSVLYLNGVGVDRDYGEARNWASAAAEQGDVQSFHNLGYIYQNGLGTDKDPAAATQWYTKAAEQGFTKSQYSLGVMNMAGQGVPVDYAAAEKWFRVAAEAGDPEAQTGLGALYANGQGLAQDNVLAHVWFQLAAEQGYAPAGEYRDMVAERLSPEQLADARNTAVEWQRQRASGGQVAAAPASGGDAGNTAPAASAKANASTAVFYPVESDRTVGNPSEGTVTWDRQEKGGQPPAIRATVEFADPAFSMVLTISKNTDEYLPATHLVEITINDAFALSEIPVERIPALFLKSGRDGEGKALVGAGVRVTDRIYWLALSEIPETASQNISLLRSSTWFEMPIELKDRTRSLVAFPKSAAGKRVVESVIAEWGGSTSAKAQ